MFGKLRRKIVLSMLTVLTVLLVGILIVIYAASYQSAISDADALLDMYAETYRLNPAVKADLASSDDYLYGNAPRRIEDDFHPYAPFQKGILNERAESRYKKDMFRIAAFYSVAAGKDGEIIETENLNGIMTDGELDALALEIIESGKSRGTIGSLEYLVTDTPLYTLVSFYDNTVALKSLNDLFEYTLLFGIIAIGALFFASLFLSKIMVRPLEEGFEKQKRFISDAGHEFKTPISAININAEILSREIGDNKWLKNIIYENGKMSDLTRSLLELACTESVEYNLDVINLSTITEGEALAFEATAFELGISFEYLIDENVFIRGDIPRIKQLISILLNNASSYCGDKKYINLRLKADKNAALLSIANDGDPIPKEALDTVFERFVRLDGARSDINHYGLGLSIADAVAKKHNAQIAAACANGMITFTVKFPLSSKGRIGH